VNFKLLIFFLFLVIIPYSIIRSELNNFVELSFDKNLVIVADYGFKCCPLVYVGKVYNPLIIANFENKKYKDYLKSGDEKDLVLMLAQLNWILKNRKERKYRDFTYWIWECNFTWPYPEYGLLQRGWVSGLAQISIANAFNDAYFITKDEFYLQAINYTLLAFKVPIENGGLRYEKQGFLWYPEYYHKGLAGIKEPPYVLNGFMFVVINFYRIWERHKINLALELFEEAEPYIAKNLQIYDGGDCSYYDALGNVGGPRYNTYTKIHVSLLNILYNITGRETYRYYAEKWKNC